MRRECDVLAPGARDGTVIVGMDVVRGAAVEEPVCDSMSGFCREGEQPCRVGVRANMRTHGVQDPVWGLASNKRSVYVAGGLPPG